MRHESVRSGWWPPFLSGNSAIHQMSSLSLDKSRAVVDSLWAVTWVSESDGLMECPGASRHTTKDGARDCRIMLDGGKPPTIHCLHASCSAEVDAANFRLRSELGKEERREEGGQSPEIRNQRSEVRSQRKEPEDPPSYDEEKLRAFAGDYAATVDAAWLANRSVIDPSSCTAHDFLSALYHPERGEKVVVFTQEYSQGEALWPDDKNLPTRGREGVWFLAQPVSGEFLPNPRSIPPGKLSRRMAECVRAWRFLLLESDNAPARLWLGAVVQLPLRIAAIYTSGSRSVHVLVQVDAKVKEDWEREKSALLRGMITLGACRGSLSSVRLTRLPNCLRFGKQTEVVDPTTQQKVKRYQPFPKPGLQKLLYLCPNPSVRSIASIVPRRDVIPELEGSIKALSLELDQKSPEELERLQSRFAHFGGQSDRCKTVAAEMEEMISAAKGAHA